MGFYAKDEPEHPAAKRAVTGTLSHARNPRSENVIPPILTVGIGHRFYSPSLGRWLSRDPIMEHSLFLMAAEGMKEEDRDELWLAVPGHEFRFTQNDPLNRIDPVGLTDRWWPFNGRIKVDSKCKDKNIQGVDIDNRKVYNPQPGESTPWNDDVDFVQCDGKWYKIGAANYEVKPDDKGCCKRPDGFQEATPDERKAIDDIIRNPGKKDKT